MTKKESIVKYISEMNIDKLALVLAHDTSFMDITKELFLSKLQKVFEVLRAKNITVFSKVLTGVCEADSKCKDMEGCQFITSDKRSLTLLFEERRGEIIDIHGCSKFRTYQDSEETTPIPISIWADEKIGYQPTVDHIILTQKMDAFYVQFEVFKNTVTPIEQYASYFKPVKALYDSIPLIAHLGFKFFYHFSYFVVDHLFPLIILENNEIAQKALRDYERRDISNELDVLEWRFKYDDVRRFLDDELEKVGDWQNQCFLILKKEPSIILDCSNYKAPFKFQALHEKHEAAQILNGI